MQTPLEDFYKLATNHKRADRTTHEVPMTGGLKKNKCNTTSETLDSSEDERLMPKKATPGVSNPANMMNLDEEEQPRGRSFSNTSDSDGDAKKKPEEKKPLEDPPGFEQPPFQKMTLPSLPVRKRGP